MIAHVRGALVHSGADSVVIDVGGIGYRCFVPGSTRSRLPASGQEVLLHTSMQVREDSMTLYGFATREEFDLFELLLKVDGIGPKVALGILSTCPPDSFRRAVAFEDVNTLTKVPGIGKKTAQRLVLELKDKVGSLGSAPGAAPVPTIDLGSATPDAFIEALEALMALGYSRSDAGGALENARKEAGEEPSTQELVRLGLKHLFRG